MWEYVPAGDDGSAVSTSLLLNASSGITRLGTTLGAMLGWSLCPLAILALLLRPSQTAELLPWLTVALASFLCAVVTLRTNPGRLNRLPLALVSVTLLRLLADISGAVLLVRGEMLATTPLFPTEFPALIVALLTLQLGVILVGRGQADRMIVARFDWENILPGYQAQIDTCLMTGDLGPEEARVQRRQLEMLDDFFEFLFWAARLAWLDTAVSVFALSISGWEIWALHHGSPGGADLLATILTHDSLSAISAVLLHATLESARIKAVRAGAPASPAARHDFNFGQPLVLELGVQLLALVDPRHGQRLMTKISSVRAALRDELGLQAPGICVVANLGLPADGYQFRIFDQVVAQGQVRRGLLLAIGPRFSLAGLEGEAVEEPVYGLPARWVSPDVTMPGCLMFDEVAVIASHLMRCLREHGGTLLSREQAAEWTSILGHDVDHAHRVLSLLLGDQIPIHGLDATVAPLPHLSACPAIATAAIRRALARPLCLQLADSAGTIRAYALDHSAEKALAEGLAEPEGFGWRLASALFDCRKEGRRPIFVTTCPLQRHSVAQALHAISPESAIISRAEVHPGFHLQLSPL